MRMSVKQKFMKEESIMASEFTFEITKHIGGIGTYETGWRKEINLHPGTAVSLRLISGTGMRIMIECQEV